MMRLCPAPLSPEEARSLRELQAQIDAAPDHGARVSRALSQWNVAALGGARDKLMAARPRLERCVYCEDSLGKQLDHLRPRTTCPELTWAFTNLVVACDCCNGRSYKGSRDAILDANVPTGWREITPRRGARDQTPPPLGEGAWLNPHAVNPLDLVKLDIPGDTFWLLNVAAVGPQRAMVDWTLAALQLNDRVSLVKARRVAYHAHRRWLEEVGAATEAADLTMLVRLRRELGDMHHPTVWEEMKRQRHDLPELARLFDAAPDTLTW